MLHSVSVSYSCRSVSKTDIVTTKTGSQKVEIKSQQSEKSLADSDDWLVLFSNFVILKLIGIVLVLL